MYRGTRSLHDQLTVRMVIHLVVRKRDRGGQRWSTTDILVRQLKRRSLGCFPAGPKPGWEGAGSSPKLLSGACRWSSSAGSELAWEHLGQADRRRCEENGLGTSVRTTSVLPVLLLCGSYAACSLHLAHYPAAGAAGGHVIQTTARHSQAVVSSWTGTWVGAPGPN